MKKLLLSITLLIFITIKEENILLVINDVNLLKLKIKYIMKLII